MNPLDQLEPLIAPAPIDWWPPAPGWWLLALLVPLMVWGLTRLWQRLKRRRTASVSDNALDPLRLAALAELEQLGKPYGGAPPRPRLPPLNGPLQPPSPPPPPPPPPPRPRPPPSRSAPGRSGARVDPAGS